MFRVPLAALAEAVAEALELLESLQAVVADLRSAAVFLVQAVFLV